MRSLRSLILLGVSITGIWFFLQHYRITGLEQVSVQQREIVPTSTSRGGAGSIEAVPLSDRQSETIRIASFNIQIFGESKLAKPHAINTIVEIIRKFDVVAIQEVRAKTQDVLPRFIEMINATGRHYDYVIGPRLGRTDSKEQYAFVYDTASIEVDRNALYTVNDPDDLMEREPLVGWFRVRGPPENQAFTFSLIDIHTQPSKVKVELDVLGDVYRAVRDDGRGEDDIILLGDLNVDDRHLGRLGQVPNITWLISGIPTNTRGDKQYDNIVFTRTATPEFTGHAGVFDMIREFNLTMDQALEISDHMPIWAEFSIYENNPTGRIAFHGEGRAAK